MSSRNYSPFKGPLGKYRRDVPPPEHQPDLNVGGLVSVRKWRKVTYKQPFLDDLTGYYRFPATIAGVEAYTQKRHLRFPGKVRRAVGPQDIRQLIEVRNAAKMQVIHKAESAELATSVFLGVAVLRDMAVTKTLTQVINQEPLDTDAALFAADAVVDLGLCLEEPYENNWMLKPGPYNPAPQGLKVQLDRIAPDIGTQMANLGAYATEYPETLRTDEGVVALQTALEEQDYRISTWAPRHEAVTQAFPELTISEDVLMLRLPLSSILNLQNNLTRRPNSK
jgi:hypothetical protein